MATNVTRFSTSVIDSELATLAREIDWAIDLVRRWDTADEAEQTDLAAEWPLIQGFYRAAAERERRGELTTEQLERFDGARRAFREHHDVLVAALGTQWVTIGVDQLAPPR